MDERIRINSIDYKITPCPQSDWTDAVLVTSENWKRIYETREIAISDLTKTEPAPWFLRRLA